MGVSVEAPWRDGNRGGQEVRPGPALCVGHLGLLHWKEAVLAEPLGREEWQL